MGKVQPLGDPAKHFWLSRSVARAMGISLSEAMAEGRLSAADYAALVTRCRTCTSVSSCQAWLGQTAGCAAEAPKECMHAELFEHLSRRP